MSIDSPPFTTRWSIDSLVFLLVWIVHAGPNSFTLESDLVDIRLSLAPGSEINKRKLVIENSILLINMSKNNNFLFLNYRYRSTKNITTVYLRLICLNIWSKLSRSKNIGFKRLSNLIRILL